MRNMLLPDKTLPYVQSVHPENEGCTANGCTPESTDEDVRGEIMWYRDAALVSLGGNMDRMAQMYRAAGYEQEEGEMDTDFMRRASEQDYADGAHGGAVFQEIYNQAHERESVKEGEKRP